MSTQKHTAINVIEKITFVYLACMPALGLVSVQKYLPIPSLLVFMALFVVGIAVVAIYIAATVSYTAPSRTIWHALVVLVDGPLIALVTSLFTNSTQHVLVTTACIEIMNVLLGIFVVATTSPLPTPAQRRGSLLITGGGFLLIVWLMWIYLARTNTLSLMLILGTVVAVIQGAYAQGMLAKRDTVFRDATPYVLVAVLTWVVALFTASLFQ